MDSTTQAIYYLWERSDDLMIYETYWYIMSTDQMIVFDFATFHCFSQNLIPVQKHLAKHRPTIVNLKTHVSTHSVQSDLSFRSCTSNN